MAEDKDIGAKGAIQWGFASAKLNSKNIKNHGSPIAYTSNQLQVFAKLLEQSYKEIIEGSYKFKTDKEIIAYRTGVTETLKSLKKAFMEIGEL